MILYTIESGVYHPRLMVFIHDGVSAAGCGNSKSATFSISGIGHVAPQAEPSLFNRTLDAWLSGSETFHSG
ncbi:hypothetical protein [Bacillus inaquosorum]|uniref:hypothetical protein n=1 Tax=Bacillus inaquosorum TaxID=483913 RepID=UPI002E0B933C|nr:hypothetical protein [Bacillus inaquosorum]MED1196264.1 hypothetical protein [Bacillus inaquosorum]MED1222544.1 hypothetical protein [Bacillus inaquosorum]